MGRSEWGQLLTFGETRVHALAFIGWTRDTLSADRYRLSLLVADGRVRDFVLSGGDAIEAGEWVHSLESPDLRDEL